MLNPKLSGTEEMHELKEHLYCLLANNIEYNADCNVFAADVITSTAADRRIVDVAVSSEAGSINQTDDEDFYIDALIVTDLPFLIYGACFCLSAYGTRNALPALILKEESTDTIANNEISRTISNILKRTGTSQDQMAVLRDPDFRTIRWNKSTMAFFCQFCALSLSLNLNIEDDLTIALGDLLARELNVSLDGHDSIDSFRICHMDTEAYYSEMERLDKTLRSELVLSNALKDTAITECNESKLTEIYYELMNEFLNARIVKEFGQKIVQR